MYFLKFEESFSALNFLDIIGEDLSLIQKNFVVSLDDFSIHYLVPTAILFALPENILNLYIDVSILSMYSMYPASTIECARISRMSASNIKIPRRNLVVLRLPYNSDF